MLAMYVLPVCRPSRSRSRHAVPNCLPPQSNQRPPVPELLRQLQHGSQEEQAQAALELERQISAAQVAVRSAVVEAGGIPVVVAALGSSSTQVQGAAAGEWPAGHGFQYGCSCPAGGPRDSCAAHKLCARIKASKACIHACTQPRS
jgi:hypothetical protein